MPYQIHTLEEIMHPFTESNALSKYMREKLSRTKGDVLTMLDVMQYLAGVRIAEEMVFTDDKGDGLYHDYKNLAEQYVEIAVNGQGDSWLMELSSGFVHFFDHNDGSTISLDIDFWQFLQLADLISQYEQTGEPGVYEAMKMIDATLPERYPFKL